MKNWDIVVESLGMQLKDVGYGSRKQRRDHEKAERKKTVAAIRRKHEGRQFIDAKTP